MEDALMGSSVNKITTFPYEKSHRTTIVTLAVNLGIEVSSNISTHYEKFTHCTNLEANSFVGRFSNDRKFEL